jgi:hypothetical protein
MFRSALRSIYARRAFSSTAQAPDVSWLRSAPSIYCQPVEWGSQDTFQHVNNVVYHRYIENGRLDYLTCLRAALIKLYGPESAEQKHWTRFMSSRAVGPILKSADIKFRFPVTVRIFRSRKLFFAFKLLSLSHVHCVLFAMFSLTLQFFLCRAVSG